jgi:hypothetical protein
MNPIVSWLFALMVAFAPPDKTSKAFQFPGHEETAEQKSARYQSIAEDLYDVVYDPDVEPVYAGPKGRRRTALLVLAIAFHESGFAHDVDIGPCYLGKDGTSARCDHGKSACVMQLHIGEGTTPEGYTQADLFADRKKCFRAALARIRSSLGECKHLDEKHRLNAYASGVCTRGDEQSEELSALVDKFGAKVAPPPEDDAVYVKGAPAKPAEPKKDEPKKDPPAEKGTKDRPRTAPARPNRSRSVSIAK